jgi:cytochrome c biogenesis protein CcmG, thiol:disulfide interchange protein DsbE
LNRRNFLKILSCTGLAFVLPQCRSGSLQIGDLAPDFSVVDLKGKSLSVPGEFKGKVVLLHFWVSWCRVCVNEMRAMESIYAEYGSRGVIPCSVSIGDRKEAVEDYIKDLQIYYPVLIDGKAVSKRLYGVTGVPTTLALDRQGIIRSRAIVPLGRDQQERMVKPLL